MNDAPVLDAYTTACGRCAVVFCDFCARLHTHGAVAGHRVAHCMSPESPYARTGYVLRLAGPLTPQLSRDFRRMGARVRAERRAARRQAVAVAAQRCQFTATSTGEQCRHVAVYVHGVLPPRCGQHDVPLPDLIVAAAKASRRDLLGWDRPRDGAA